MSPCLCQSVRMIRPLLMCFVLCVVYGSSKPTEKKSRVHEEPLSRLVHDDNKNYDYDHEAFLGQEEAKTFEHLPPEESKRRLGWVQRKEKCPSAQWRQIVCNVTEEDSTVFLYVQ